MVTCYSRQGQYAFISCHAPLSTPSPRYHSQQQNPTFFFNSVLINVYIRKTTNFRALRICDRIFFFFFFHIKYLYLDLDLSTLQSDCTCTCNWNISRYLELDLNTVACTWTQSWITALGHATPELAGLSTRAVPARGGRQPGNVAMWPSPDL